MIELIPDVDATSDRAAASRLRVARLRVRRAKAIERKITKSREIKSKTMAELASAMIAKTMSAIANDRRLVEANEKIPPSKLKFLKIVGSSNRGIIRLSTELVDE